MAEIIASELITQNSREYAQYVLTAMFPSPIDGFKRVHRRIISNQPKEGDFGGMTLVANTLKTHPHGDASAYEAATRLAEPFVYLFPLIDNLSKGGTYAGENAAASRYTKFRLSDFCKDIYFRGIDSKTIPTEPTEDLLDVEYQYLIPKVPTALLFNNDAIGYGHSSRTLPLKFESICDLTTDYIDSKDRANWNGANRPHAFIPCFPVDVAIKNYPQLLKSYRAGNFTAPVETEGVYTINAANCVTIRTLSYGATPSSVKTNIVSQLRDKNHWLVKEFDATPEMLDASQHYLDLQITTKRGTNILEVIDRLRTTLRLSGAFHPINHWCHQSALVRFDPHMVIKCWYKERYRSKLGTLKYKQQQLFLQKLQVETYLVICEHVDEVVKAIRSYEEEELMKWLQSKFQLSPRQCEILLSANFKILMNSKRAELEAKLAGLAGELEAIQKAFTTIDLDLSNEIGQLRRKYKTRTQFVSKVDDYIGCLLIQKVGIIQIRTVDEIADLARLWSVPMRFVKYHRGIKSIGIRNRSYTTPSEVPYTTAVSQLSVSYGKLLFTRYGNYSKLSADSVSINTDPGIMNWVTDNCWVIQDGGQMRPFNGTVSNAKGTKTLYAFDPTEGVSEYIVASVDPRYPNNIRLQKVKLGNRVKLVAGGNPSIIAVIPFGKDGGWYPLPSEHRWNMVELTDLSRHFKKQTVVDINFRSWNKF